MCDTKQLYGYRSSKCYHISCFIFKILFHIRERCSIGWIGCWLIHMGNSFIFKIILNITINNIKTSDLFVCLFVCLFISYNNTKSQSNKLSLKQKFCSAYFQYGPLVFQNFCFFYRHQTFCFYWVNLYEEIF